jgi:hypothetical protein
MDATVQWTANTEPDLAGYNVWHGYGQGSNPALLDAYFEFFTVLAPATQYTFSGLDDFKTHHFAVTAFDNAVPPNESGQSIDVQKRVSHRFTLR